MSTYRFPSASTALEAKKAFLRKYHRTANHCFRDHNGGYIIFDTVEEVNRWHKKEYGTYFYKEEYEPGTIFTKADAQKEIDEWYKQDIDTTLNNRDFSRPILAIGLNRVFSNRMLLSFIRSTEEDDLPYRFRLHYDATYLWNVSDDSNDDIREKLNNLLYRYYYDARFKKRIEGAKIELEKREAERKKQEAEARQRREETERKKQEALQRLRQEAEEQRKKEEAERKRQEEAALLSEKKMHNAKLEKTYMTYLSNQGYLQKIKNCKEYMDNLGVLLTLLFIAFVIASFYFAYNLTSSKGHDWSYFMNSEDNTFQSFLAFCGAYILSPLTASIAGGLVFLLIGYGLSIPLTDKIETIKNKAQKEFEDSNELSEEDKKYISEIRIDRQ